MANAVMLLPGLLCDWALWEGVQTGLAADCQVADLSRDDSIAAMAARTLAAAPPRFAAVGLSMGGYVALEIMRQAPERVSHLALLDSAGGADGEARKEQRRGGMVATGQGKFGLVVQAMVPGLLAPDHVDGALADIVREMAARVGPEAYLRQQTAIMGRIDSRPHLAEIRVPTLVGVGTLDTLTPPALAEEMAGMIPGAELVQFAGSGHLSSLEAPQAVREALQGLLARPSGG